jgi:SAM-dependent methyltransferase
MAKKRHLQNRLSTKDQWDAFFKKDGQWEANRGREQTRLFAEAFCRHTRIDLENGWSLLDSSCALGDALPVFNKHFPNAQLYACDFSTEAIQRCKERFGNLASFFLSSIEEISSMYDVIYSSNTLEHFTDYKDKARTLLQHCRYLCILVPYNEKRFGKDLEYDPYSHHVVTFHEHSFDFLLEEARAKRICSPSIFTVPKAWSWSLRQWIVQPPKNIARRLLKRPIVQNKRQILFEVERGE